MRYRVAIRFAIDGDLRFISHHDTMRLFERALGRAQLPARFSEGFNPRPGLSLPLPRAVGIASDVELLVLDLDEPVEPESVLARMASQMPAGLTLDRAWQLRTSRAPQPRRVTYAVPVPDDRHEAVQRTVERILSAETWPIPRPDPGRAEPRMIDLRVFVETAALADGILRWTCRVTQGGSARPAECLAAVGLEPQDHLHRVRRIAVDWHDEAAAQQDSSEAVAVRPSDCEHPG